MGQTGFAIPNWITVLAMVLPLISVFLIISRQSFHEKNLIFLMMLCLLLFVQQLLLNLPPFAGIDSSLIQSIFGLCEFVLLVGLFRSTIHQQWIKEVISYLGISFLAVVITIYSLQEIKLYSQAIAATGAVIIIVLSLHSLLQLINNRTIFIFQTPLFWIAGGTLCYFTMFLVLMILSYTSVFKNFNKGEEKIILLPVFNLFRFLFYVIAAAVKQRNQKEDEWMLF